MELHGQYYGRLYLLLSPKQITLIKNTFRRMRQHIFFVLLMHILKMATTHPVHMNIFFSQIGQKITLLRNFVIRHIFSPRYTGQTCKRLCDWRKIVIKAFVQYIAVMESQYVVLNIYDISIIASVHAMSD